MADKLNVLRVIDDAFLHIWRERRTLLIFFAAVIVFMVAGLALVVAVGMASTALLSVVALAFFFAFVVISLSMSVAWHRTYLIGGEPITRETFFGWNRRIYLFFRASMILTLLMFVILVPLSVVSGAVLGALIFAGSNSGSMSAATESLFVGLVFTGAFSFILFWAIGPVMLMAPAAALGQKLRFGDCYTYVRGQRTALAAVFAISALPTVVIDWLVRKLNGRTAASWAGDTVAGFGDFVGLIVLGLTYAATIAFGITVLSIAYRLLVPPADQAPLLTSAD